MGLIVNIYRSDYDSTLNVFNGKSRICVTNMEGPFQPDEDMPEAELALNQLGNPIIRPVFAEPYEGVLMAGGTFANSSDSRFREAVGIYGAIPIHDRVESWALYESMSR